MPRSDAVRAQAGADAGSQLKPDSSPPSVPTVLTAVASGPRQVKLFWAPSTDDRGVAGYRVFRDASFLASATASALVDEGVLPGTTYCYAVSAVDAAGNELYARSTDRGSSFSLPLFVSTIDDSNSDEPGIAASGGGAVSLVWADARLLAGGSTLSLSRSDDDGETFSPSIPLPSVGHAVCPVVLGSSHPLHLAWAEGSGAELRIHHVRTDSSGAFGPPSVIDDGKGRSVCPQMARGASGRVYLVWEEGTVPENRWISFTASDVQGDTFAARTTLSPTDQNVTCPSLATTPGGRIVVGWTEVNSDFTLGHSFVVFSDDGGASFSPPLRVRLPGTDAACAQILADDEGIDLVWREISADVPVHDVFYARARILPP